MHFFCYKLLSFVKNLRLIRILQTLSPAEMRKFKKYVCSPVHNQHKDTIRLFELLHQYYPDFESEELDRHAVFSSLFPNRPYDDQKLRSLRKYLFDLLIDFITDLEIEQYPLVRQSYKLKALHYRHLEKEFIQYLKKERKQLEAYPYRNADYFLAKYFLEDEVLVYQMSKSRWAMDQPQSVIQALNHFYLSEKLRYCVSMMNIQQIFKVEKEIPMYEEVVQYCRNHLASLPPIIQAYYHLLSLNQEEDAHQHFVVLKQLGQTQFTSFPSDDWINIYYSMINYCHHRYLAGDIGFLSEMLDLYAVMLERKLLLEDGFLSTHNYKNITTLGLRLGKYEWTESFIETYKDYIQPQFRQGIYSYNLAHLYFYQQKYRQALRLLNQIDFIDTFYRISYNILQLKIYYECNEAEALLSLCESFRTFIRRKKELTASVKKSYTNFAKYVRALFMVKIGIDKRADKLKDKIENCDALTERQWVLQKLADLSHKAEKAVS
ncbi:MAG: hypothetical protein D6730_12875 [Bacteroidetes bacterium]|nr:MAG: hypothetical protein D6730_12875 [Bacteroidota bacterium]